MFSGLTSQVSTWMGKKAEDGTEQPPGELAPGEPAPEALDPAASATTAAGGVSSKLEMLSGVKSQVASSMSGWLSGGIPGLNRGGAAEAGEQQQPEAGAEQTTGDSAPTGAGATDNVKDDDASSATGGADSGPGSLGGTPTEEKDGQQPFGAVSTKAMAGAKSLGGFLFSAVNKAGKSVAEAGAKIKKTVEENRLIAELNKEQEAFIAGKPGEKGEAVAPWIGVPNEDALREECLALSTDKRNFVRAPPPGVEFAWDFEAVQPMAQATLALDPNLEAMRFELVPKVISEENFWRNYFYRVSLLRQSHELNAMTSESTESNAGQLATSDSVEQAAAASVLEAKRDAGVAAVKVEAIIEKAASEPDVDEVKEGVKKLGTQPKKAEEDWERELEAELKDYEVVSGGQDTARPKDNDWEDEGQIDELLAEEDLK